MSRYINQIKPKQEKFIKHIPISEGGLGLTPRTDGGSVDSDIKKAKENKLAKYCSCYKTVHRLGFIFWKKEF